MITSHQITGAKNTCPVSSLPDPTGSRRKELNENFKQLDLTGSVIKGRFRSEFSMDDLVKPLYLFLIVICKIRMFFTKSDLSKTDFKGEVMTISKCEVTDETKTVCLKSKMETSSSAVSDYPNLILIFYLFTLLP